MVGCWGRILNCWVSIKDAKAKYGVQDEFGESFES
jgi:hypothetical protein